MPGEKPGRKRRDLLIIKRPGHIIFSTGTMARLGDQTSCNLQINPLEKTIKVLDGPLTKLSRTGNGFARKVWPAKCSHVDAKWLPCGLYLPVPGEENTYIWTGKEEK